MTHISGLPLLVAWGHHFLSQGVIDLYKGCEISIKHVMHAAYQHVEQSTCLLANAPGFFAYCMRAIHLNLTEKTHEGHT